jgi:hypothetical protein
MTATTSAPIPALVTGPRYYRSFASYYIPFRPVDELTYAQTEGAAYSVAYHDAEGRVVSFAKVQLVRPSKDERLIPLAGGRAPGTRVYFAPDGTEPIGYADTADLPAYDVGTVGPSGLSVAVVRIEKRIALHDVYIYRSDGTLRERRTESGGRTAVEVYDRTGARTETPPADDIVVRMPLPPVR